MLNTAKSELMEASLTSVTDCDKSKPSLSTKEIFFFTSSLVYHYLVPPEIVIKTECMLNVTKRQIF